MADDECGHRVILASLELQTDDTENTTMADDRMAVLDTVRKAIADGANEGVVKVITSEPYGEILGAHIVGENASELIHEICVAKRLEGG